MPSEQELLFFRMLSAFSPTPLSHDNYMLGMPVEHQTPNTNTVISLQPKIRSHEYFDRVLAYTRAELEVISIISVTKGSATDLYGLLDQVNNEPLYEVIQRDGPHADFYTVPGSIQPEDVINVPIPAHGIKEYVDVPMFAVPEALFVKGSMVIRVYK